MRSARSTRPSSSKTSRTASAAACATGLPTYVPPTADSAGASMISALPSTPESGRPGGDRLRDDHQVGLDRRSARSRTSCRCARSRSAPRRRRARSRAGRRCARTPCDELRRRDDEPALALHRLEHDRRDRLGGDLRRERALERSERVRGRDAAVLVRERNAVDLRRERAEPRLVRMRLRRQRQREQRAPVEGALEADHRRPAGVGARELDAVLDRLGAGVEEGRLRRPAERREREQPLGER